MDHTLLEQVKASALWAAYGDALGFITELTDTVGLRRRAHVDRVVETVQWQRLVGGRFGAMATLPPGCYSDDTQLRLSTCRAIGKDGHFDVEAFAKIELPVWLSYSLGAGSGTKAAASNLASSDVNWFSNFFTSKTATYLDGGGNGAAMRIQPHVWASNNKANDQTYLGPLIRNAVCTHGHARAIAGAVLHGFTLADVISNKSLISPDRWADFVRGFHKIVKTTKEDRELGSFWLPVWEKRTGNSLQNAVAAVQEECLSDIELIRPLVEGATVDGYRKVLEAIGGLDVRTRGSATKTVLAALALCWMYRDETPDAALITAANVLGSDTDTIASIAGAYLGATTNQHPRGIVMDREYIESEAIRLHNISEGQHGVSFRYPDLMTWVPPKTQSDAVGLLNGTPMLNGLGKAQRIGPPIFGQGRDPAAWQWLRLEFGQCVIAKFRQSPSELKSESARSETPIKALATPKRESSAVRDRTPMPTRNPAALQEHLFPPETIERTSTGRGELSRTLDQLTAEAIRSGFAPELIGQHILLLSEREDGIERAVSYVAIIAKAKRARIGRR